MRPDPAPVPVRAAFHDELDQLRLQVELMGVRVDQNLERMGQVFGSGDTSVVDHALRADDEIDAMHISLLERCYQLLNREAPMLSDLRFLVSVVRILSELERVGDLALRVIKLAPEAGLLAESGAAWDIVRTLSDTAVEQYRTALRAWSAQDLGLATELAENRPHFGSHLERLMAELRRFDGVDAVRVAMGVYVAGQAADRIADHAMIIGARLRYLITGEADHLAAEVR
jgi:phosphate transport system protein